MATEAEIRERVSHFTRFPVRGRLNIVADTTEFMNIGVDDILELGGRYFLVRGEEVEGRFGLDGEPKFWVKKAIDLSDGSFKVIKLVFHETFMMRIGEQEVKCFRSPQKESRILDRVHGDDRFMQGVTVNDTAGNPARIIDKIQGKRFYDIINDMYGVDHRTYFERHFPTIFENVLSCVDAIRRLHEMGELHGDIRNDHILIDRATGTYTWIDFDYTYEWTENPYGVDLFGLGSVLLFAVGNGFHNLADLNACAPKGMSVVSCLTHQDLSLFFQHRVMNLKKLFPYIPECLNQILMRFSNGSEVFYDDARELMADLLQCREELRGALRAEESEVLV